MEGGRWFPPFGAQARSPRVPARRQPVKPARVVCRRWKGPDELVGERQACNASRVHRWFFRAGGWGAAAVGAVSGEVQPKTGRTRQPDQPPAPRKLDRQTPRGIIRPVVAGPRPGQGPGIQPPFALMIAFVPSYPASRPGRPRTSLGHDEASGADLNIGLRSSWNFVGAPTNSLRLFQNGSVRRDSAIRGASRVEADRLVSNEHSDLFDRRSRPGAGAAFQMEFGENAAGVQPAVWTVSRSAGDATGRRSRASGSSRVVSWAGGTAVAPG